MESDSLSKYFEVFGLTTIASLARLDEVYFDRTQDLQRHKVEDPIRVDMEQKSLDDSYLVLLRHFIRKECERGEYHRHLDLAHANIVNRRDEPSVFRSPESIRRAAMATSPRTTNLAIPIETGQGGPRTIGLNPAKPSQDEPPSGSEKGVLNTGTQERCTNQPRITSHEILFETIHVQGDIFDIPDNAVIIHAVNCQGVWGAGFANDLRLRYPAAYTKYESICRKVKPSKLVGSSILIPPQAADYRTAHGQRKPRRWIACLFTSEGYGAPSAHNSNPGRDSQQTILMHTDSALVDLKTILQKSRTAKEDDRPLMDLYSPKLNAGNFQVPWVHTEQLIYTCFAGYDGIWYIVSPGEHRRQYMQHDSWHNIYQ